VLGGVRGAQSVVEATSVGCEASDIGPREYIGWQELGGEGFGGFSELG
jgi:hypothetical protein